ncbi:E3 ubiquitin-protein ligase [Canna indica]|uniref:E3 ubiquitin-protein ligase n=1 Tax=Canna indica TaxID=4628 RepID=A0AAQ3QGY2_9LILI|nr:E3 ubiquitin-protein ligase [Canna indica]
MMLHVLYAIKCCPKVLLVPVCLITFLYASLMRPVDINPGDEWINVSTTTATMVVTVSDGNGWNFSTIMKTAYRSVMFYIGQKELEMQLKMNKIIGQCRQKCEDMQEKFTEKLEQVHTAYQKMAKRCQMMEKEIESLSKDKQELQEKYSEKSRQKRKLDEMYDKLRNDYESVKRSAIQSANFFPRAEPNLFSISSMDNMMDARDTLGQDRSVFPPETPGRREDIWPSTKQKNSGTNAFDFSGGSPAKTTEGPVDTGTRMKTGPLFGAGTRNPGATLRNLIISPMKRPQLSRNRPHVFTL